MTGSRSGWPVLLADLALILFVATAVQASHSAQKNGQPAAEPAAPGVPQAFYSAGPGAPPLSQWIAQQGLGGEAQVTILSSYRPGGAVEAMAKAQALAREAQAAGRPPRVLVEPGDGSTRAILAFDHPEQ
ncbi:MAG: hypothetical protein KDE32_13570 [Novosphingobium sp.]|nr:hypothetical protein [Novosphingobium sp.]